MNESTQTTSASSHVSLRIREYMDKNNLSSNSVARTCNVSPSTINNIYRGTTTDPAVSIIVRFCEAFGLSAQWLISGDGPQQKDDLIRKISKVVSAPQMVGGSNNQQVNDTTLALGWNNNISNDSQSVAKLNEVIASLHAQIAQLNETISTQSQTISSLTTTLITKISK